MRARAVGERLLLTAWVGALWTVGYIAAPVLFATLDDRALAGHLAGRMFTAVSYLSLIAGGGLALLQLVREPSPRNWRLWVIVAMIALIAVGEFLIRVWMVQAPPAEFGRWHGIAQGIYSVVSLLGLALVAFGPNGEDPSPV